MGLILLLLPLFGILLFAAASKKIILDIISALILLSMLAIGVVLTGDVINSGSIMYAFLGGFFYMDSVSAIFLDIVLLICFLCGIYSIGYLNEELKHKRIETSKVKTYYILLNSFVFTMILVLTARNMGIMWIAIEATTLASAFLVGFYNSKRAIEAAWKYVIICSVGIAVALLGIIFLHLSYAGVSGLKGIQLDWTSLYQNAKALDSSILKLAFIFILIGFGTKAGLAPMHTWLPDAHSQAPSPISAMLSGVLLNSAMYAIIRTVSILNKNLGNSEYSGRLLIIIGLLSMAAAAIFIITQKDYKRLLAYSSIEHMGIISLSIGMFTPASIFAALLHTINHSLTKSMLFLSSGSVLLKYDTRQISRIRGVLKTLPVSGTAMLLGLFAIAGTPPFSVFTSEFYVIAAAFGAKKYLVGILVMLFLALVFAGIAFTMLRMFYPGEKSSRVSKGEPNIIIPSVIMTLLVIIAVTGLFIPGDVKQLINTAQRIITGG
ncbi:MAG: hydrogenase 4 subunit F [Bacillota bacterium]|nr:hydrogenase 4 subunit F [Bacillota bacterium]